MTCVHTITPGRAVAKTNKQNTSLPERDGASASNSDRKNSGKLAASLLARVREFLKCLTPLNFLGKTAVNPVGV